jgi:hypothetical protein
MRSAERGRRAPAGDLLHCCGEVWERVTFYKCGQSAP